MSATIQLSGTESESQVHKAESGQNVRDQSIDSGDREHQVKKGNGDI